MSLEIGTKNPDYQEFCAILNPSPARNSPFSQAERLLIVRQFIEGEISTQEAVERYKIGNENNLYRWLGRFMEALLQMRRKRQNKPDELEAMSPQELLLEAKRLRQALEFEKIRSQAFSHMIEVAEQQFNIPIRKNLAPNSRLAARELSQSRIGQTLCAVWL